MNMFKPTTAKTPKEYIALISEPRKAEVQKLHDFITKTVPDLKQGMYGSIIGYGNYHYKSVSGREGDWMVIGLASQKNYISIYICATKGDKYLPELYKEKLGKVSVGKSCIRFKKVENVKLPVLKQAILEGVKLLKKTNFRIEAE